MTLIYILAFMVVFALVSTGFSRREAAAAVKQIEEHGDRAVVTTIKRNAAKAAVNLKKILVTPTWIDFIQGPVPQNIKVRKTPLGSMLVHKRQRKGRIIVW